MELNEIRCANCRSIELKIHSTYETKSNGTRKLFECTKCGSVFSETHSTVLARLRVALSFIILVIKARSEGLGLNAASRVYGVSKNTIIRWETKLGKVVTVHRVGQLVEERGPWRSLKSSFHELCKKVE